MSNQSRNPKFSSLNKNLFALVAFGFLSGLLTFITIWLPFSAFSDLPGVLPLVVGMLSVTCLLVSFRLYASITLTLAKNDQKHLQNALTQAKDMLDTNKELRDEHLLLKSLVNNLPHPIWLKDRFGRYLVTNHAFVEQWCAGQHPIGKTDADLLNDSLVESFANNDQQVMESGTPNALELQMATGQQASTWLRVERYALLGDNQQAVGTLGFAFDISAYKNERPDANSAFTDPVTRLNNYAALAAKLELDNEPSAHRVCLHIDIDRFRMLNDSLGANSGNTILATIAQRIKAKSNSHDFLARIGSDEFIVVWPSDDLEKTLNMIQKLIQSLNQPITINERDYTFTVSVGAARSPEHGTALSELLQKAGLALYNAKKRGRNQLHWYDDAYRNQASRRLDKEQTLRNAVSHKQFKVHVQPRVDSRTGVIEALECLVRIELDNGDILYPNTFIEPAEKTGLIKQIDRFVFESAIAQIEAWLSTGQQPLTLAINQCVSNIDDNLLARLEELYKNTPEVFKYLEIELTENSLPENDSTFLQRLQTLNNFGIQLAIDDFGTGYANLSRLPNWPFQILKLDRSFIFGLLTSEKQRDVVKAVIDLCEKLNIRVVAEGVEIDRELDLVTQLGCHSIQGFIFAKPKPLKDIEPWLSNPKLSTH